MIARRRGADPLDCQPLRALRGRLAAWAARHRRGAEAPVDIWLCRQYEWAAGPVARVEPGWRDYGAARIEIAGAPGAPLPAIPVPRRLQRHGIALEGERCRSIRLSAGAALAILDELIGRLGPDWMPAPAEIDAPSPDAGAPSPSGDADAATAGGANGATGDGAAAASRDAGASPAPAAAPAEAEPAPGAPPAMAALPGGHAGEADRPARDAGVAPAPAAQPAVPGPAAQDDGPSGGAAAIDGPLHHARGGEGTSPADPSGDPETAALRAEAAQPLPPAPSPAPDTAAGHSAYGGDHSASAEALLRGLLRSPRARAEARRMAEALLLCARPRPDQAWSARACPRIDPRRLAREVAGRSYRLDRARRSLAPDRVIVAPDLSGSCAMSGPIQLAALRYAARSAPTLVVVRHSNGHPLDGPPAPDPLAAWRAILARAGHIRAVIWLGDRDGEDIRAALAAQGIRIYLIDAYRASLLARPALIDPPRRDPAATLHVIGASSPAQIAEACRRYIAPHLAGGGRHA